MNKILVLLGLVLAVFSAIIIVGYKLYGIAGAAVGVVACLLLIKGIFAFGKRKLINAGKMLFDAKSRVLREASIVIHGLKPAPAVTNEGEDSAQTLPGAKFYYLDVTIKPQLGSDTPFACWDSSDLNLVSFDAPAPSMDDDNEVDEDTFPSCIVHEVSLAQSEADQECEGEKFSGEQRLMLHIEVPRELKRVKFQYYFETFGDVALP